LRKFLIAVVIAIGLSLTLPTAVPAAEAATVGYTIFTHQTTTSRTEIRLFVENGTQVTACRDFYVGNLGASNCERYLLTNPEEYNRFYLQLWRWVWEALRN
jgi:hypothetical protein